jgi:TaqI-like C-terminal specificity domain
MFKGDKDHYALISKIEAGGLVLAFFGDIKVGLGAYGLGKGKPPQTKEMMQSRIYHSRCKEGIDWYPYIEGSDVCRYYLGWSGEYLKHGDHLREPRRNWDLFSTKRILVRQIPNKLPYCIHACYTSDVVLNDRNSMNIINLKVNPLAILGILNSRVISCWFARKFGKLQRGIFPQFKANELADFPIPKVIIEYERELADLAQEATEARKNNPINDISKIDEKIDYIVYHSFNLTPDEIALIEAAR